MLVIALAAGPVAAAEFAHSDLYERGQQAYRDKDYVGALENLFAFQVINEAQLAGEPQTRIQLENALRACRGHLRVVAGVVANPDTTSSSEELISETSHHHFKSPPPALDDSLLIKTKNTFSGKRTELIVAPEAAKPATETTSAAK